MADKAASGTSEYASMLRAGARGLWKGVFSVDQFTSAMMNAIDRGLMAAMAEGLKRCGFLPDEASANELQLLYGEIAENVSRIYDLGAFIEANSEANGGKWASVSSRLDMWVNRYPALVTAISASACRDKKQQWVLGRTEDHCESCYGFAGRVYRYGTWAANNALPQSQALCCHGFRCDCSLVDTEARITPGPFPRSLLCG